MKGEVKKYMERYGYKSIDLQLETINTYQDLMKRRLEIMNRYNTFNQEHKMPDYQTKDEFIKLDNEIRSYEFRQMELKMNNEIAQLKSMRKEHEVVLND
jgi:hypothetical protein